MIEGLKIIESKFKEYGKDYKGSYSLSKEEMLQLLSESHQTVGEHTEDETNNQQSQPKGEQKT